MKFKYFIIVATFLVLHVPAVLAKEGSGFSDSQIKKILIQESLGSYRGSCPCPENVDRAGRRCGRRSAYSRLGGASPLCYESDVTLEMINQYKREHAIMK